MLPQNNDSKRQKPPLEGSNKAQKPSTISSPYKRAQVHTRRTGLLSQSTESKKAQTSIKIARSTTMLVTYPRTRPMILLATDDEPISTSICIIAAFANTLVN